ncbi:putative lipid II flippase FtsW [Patescibacteria group bacterium]
MNTYNPIDKTFLIIVLVLLCSGFFIFISASLGLHAREGAGFSAIVFNQVFFGIVLGLGAMTFFSKIYYRNWKKYALHIFVLSIVLTVLTLIPLFGFEHGGAKRWISIGPFSFQPAEFLKFGTILYLSAWYASIRNRVHTIKWGFMPLCVVLMINGFLLLSQPDTGTFLVIAATSCAIFLIAGGKWKHLFSLILVGILMLTALAFSRPYVMDRMLTFVDPGRDPQGAGWQIQQSLIAIGSGEMFGKGFGQSVQKFNFLPEPIGDSVFAVASEEFGFMGSSVIIVLFLLFLLRGLHIAKSAPDSFSGLLASGIVIMIVVQSFTNIASILGVFPLTGLPLIFISHGGTAMLITLAMIGIVLNISRHKTNF